MSIVSVIDKGSRPRCREESLDGDFFHSKTEISFPDESGVSKERTLELRLTQPGGDNDDYQAHGNTLPLIVSMRETMDNQRFDDNYFFTHENHFMMHGWRVLERDPQSMSWPPLFVNGFSYDRDTRKLLQYSEALSAILQGERLGIRLESHPTVRRLRDQELYTLDDLSLHHSSIKVPSRKEEFLYGAFSQTSYVFDATDENGNLTTRVLELSIAQPKLDEDTDDFMNLVLPLTIGMTEIVGDRGFEDVYLFTPDNHFMMHGWRTFKRDSRSCSRVYDPTELTFDYDMKKLLDYGTVIRTMLGNKRFAPLLQDHLTVQRLRTNELWELPHDISSSSYRE
jgi:hypothetical protein